MRCGQDDEGRGRGWEGKCLAGNKVQKAPARFLAVLLQPLPTCQKKHLLFPTQTLASTPSFQWGRWEGAGKPRRTLLRRLRG